MAVQNGSQVVHIIVEKIGYLFVSTCFSGRVIKNKSKVIIKHIVASHTLWTYAAIHNGIQVVEKVNSLSRR